MKNEDFPSPSYPFHPVETALKIFGEKVYFSYIFNAESLLGIRKSLTIKEYRKNIKNVFGFLMIFRVFFFSC